MSKKPKPRTWVFRCNSCGGMFVHQTQRHTPDDPERKGPPPGCPRCNSVYFTPMNWKDA